MEIHGSSSVFQYSYTSSSSSKERGGNVSSLSDEQQQAVSKLAKRDREVRAHEAAHQAASGGLAGAASFSYTRGADGKVYAVAGEVSIDTSPVQGDPEATLQKATQIWPLRMRQPVLHHKICQWPQVRQQWQLKHGLSCQSQPVPIQKRKVVMQLIVREVC